MSHEGYWESLMGRSSSLHACFMAYTDGGGGNKREWLPVAREGCKGIVVNWRRHRISVASTGAADRSAAAAESPDTPRLGGRLIR